MRLPLTIISGYLGAGKTTLINRLLSEDHGLKLMVLVNDFGAINIDETLIETKDDAAISLSNGCVCCSIEQEFHMAISDVLKRSPRPDHLIVEASGIADPAAIAQAAQYQPELSYAGIVTLVDAENAPALMADPDVGPQVKQQIAVADLVLVTKSDALPDALGAALKDIGARSPVFPGDAPLAELLFDVVPLPHVRQTAPHPAYTTWIHDSDRVLDRRALGEKLENRPAGLYRLKGFIKTNDGGYQVHAVGRNMDARRHATDRTVLVGLGPSQKITRAEIDAWWAS